MKFISRIFPILLFAAMFASCGEDRTHEYLEKTEENQWILAQMKEYYLWSDSMTKPKQNEFFGSSSNFFYKLLYKNDNSSYMIDSAAATSYGISFAIMRDPLGIKANKYYALVLFVEPGSPAEQAGVKRGTWISRVGNRDITQSNAGYLERGNATALCTWHIDMDEESMEYIWLAGDTLEIETATETKSAPLYMDSIYNVRNHKIGYIVYNRFEKEESQNNIEAVFSKFMSQGVTELILDLRYNSGGSVEEAARIASHLVPSSMQGNTFCEIVRNKNNSEENISYTFSSTTPFETGMIYLLTTEATRGTAEAFAASLQQSIGREKVVIVGENTAGDIFCTETFVSPYNFTISPATGYIYTGNGNILSQYGLHANYTVNELAQFYKIYPLGEEQEYLLYNTFYLIINGTLPYASTNTRPTYGNSSLWHVNKGKSIIN